ncbi:MAG: ATP synthase F1 subunit gamma [Bacteroidales bacterium]|nr:ATP synthase F1 subunit gamma [Bacteroidales bacterium]
MAGLKELRTRLESAHSTQQLTSAMKMVSVSKLRKAQVRAANVRGICLRLLEVYRSIVSDKEDAEENVLLHKGYAKEEKVLLIVIASDKGMCGSFNTNICKGAEAYIKEHYTHVAQKDIRILAVGNRAVSYFSSRPYPLFKDRPGLPIEGLDYAKAAGVMKEVVAEFKAGGLHRVDIVYCKPINAATQIVRSRTILPVDGVLELGDSLLKIESRTKTSVAIIDNVHRARKYASNFDSQTEVLPDLPAVIGMMLPLIPVLYFYFTLCQSAVAEHGARMTAMSKASDNAEALIKELNLKYNKMRQSAITNELLEIVSGANALNDNE